MKNSASRHGRDTTRRARVLLSYLVVALVAASGFAQDIPLRTQKGDIQIWDEQYLRGPPKGWTAPEDYHEVFGRDMISREIRYGRFGLLSGQRLYTSWRPIVPLTDKQYAQGKVRSGKGRVLQLLSICTGGRITQYAQDNDKRQSASLWSACLKLSKA